MTKARGLTRLWPESMLRELILGHDRIVLRVTLAPCRTPSLPATSLPYPCIPESGTPLDLYDSMTDVYVKSFTHLKDRHRADDALKLLQRIASLVKPIMRKRGWVLPVLAEFFPDNPGLLGESPPVFLPYLILAGMHVNRFADLKRLWFRRPK